jgi:hypothetical protein
MSSINKHIKEFEEKFEANNSYLIHREFTDGDDDNPDIGKEIKQWLASKLQDVERETAADVIKEMQRIDNESWEWDRGDDTKVAELKQKYGLSTLSPQNTQECKHEKYIGGVCVQCDYVAFSEAEDSKDKCHHLTHLGICIELCGKPQPLQDSKEECKHHCHVGFAKCYGCKNGQCEENYYCIHCTQEGEK